MNKIVPQGNVILVVPVSTDVSFTEGTELQLISNLKTAEIVELSKNFDGIYKPGDKVLIAEKSGVEHLYKGKLHLFIDGRGMYDGGDVWAVTTEEKKKK